MMHLLYSYLLALYLIIVPGLPSTPPGTPSGTPSAPAAADTLRHEARPMASKAQAGRFTFSTTSLAFGATGLGYYREDRIAIRASAPTAVTFDTQGNRDAFQIRSTLPLTIDTSWITVAIRYTPTTAAICDTMELVIRTDTTSDTMRISGCSVDARPPFSSDTIITFGKIRVGDSISRSDILTTVFSGPVTYHYALRDSLQFAITLPDTNDAMVIDTAGLPIVLTFHPTETGTFTDRLTLRTSIGDYMVGMSGTADTPAAPTAIDSVWFVTNASSTIHIAYVGQPITIVDTIENNSSESFLVHHGDPIDPDGAFTISSPSDFVLEANSRQEISVTFAPPAMGDYTAQDTLTLAGTSNQQLRGSMTRSYKGRGLQGILNISTDTLRFTALQPGLCESGKAVEEQSVRLTNAGNIGMKIIYSLEGQGSEFSIVTPPFALDTIRLDSAGNDTITVRLCGWDSVDYTNTLLLRDARSPDVIRRVVLIHDRVTGGGQADSSLLRADVDTLSFGGVRLDSTAIDTITIRNFGTVAGIIDTSVIAGGESGEFRIIMPTGRNISVSPGSSVAIVIAFTPTSLGARASNWQGSLNRGASALRIPLIGVGVDSQNPTPDTARTAFFPRRHERVGSTIRMPLTINTGTSVAWDVARIVINPMALRLESVEPAGLTYGRSNNDSLITVYRPGGTPLTGDSTLFTLVFTGLSTGKPVNIVTIDTIRGPVPIASGADGVVELDGCDVGQYEGSSLKPSIGALRVEPGGTAAALTYRAADGAIPAIVLFDQGGTALIRRTLPTANGGAQTLWLPLRDIPRGIYWLELRVESDRLVTPIIINR